MPIPNIYVTGEEALICVEFGMRFYVSEVMETWNFLDDAAYFL